MAESSRERAVKALVEAAKTTGCEVWRDTDLERVVPPEGLIQIGEAEYTPEPMLSPLSYSHEMPADVMVTVIGVDELARDAALDALLIMLSNAIAADRTLGGVVEFADIGAPTFEAFEGDGPGKMARFAVTLCFTTIGSPLA